MTDFLPQTTAQIPGDTNKYDYRVLKRGYFSATVTGSGTTWSVRQTETIYGYDTSLVIPEVSLYLDESEFESAPDNQYPKIRKCPFTYIDSSGNVIRNVSYRVDATVKPSAITLTVDVFARSGTAPIFYFYYLVTSVETAPYFLLSNPDTTTNKQVPFS